MAWYDYPIHHGYITQYQGPNTDTPHYADDLDTGNQIDIPITSLFEGDVVKADYQPWGGEVFIRTNVPGLGPTEEYFYHNDLNEVSVGQHVKQGQEIALSGGQTSGGMHPTDPHWSSGPHIHVGFFTKYKPITEGGKTWQIPYGPDITPYLHQGGAPGTGDPCLGCGPVGSAKYAQCHAALAAKVGNVPSCAQAGIAENKKEIGDAAGSTFQQALTWLEKTLGIESNTDLLYRAGFILGGILFIIFGLMIFSRSFMSGVQQSASQVV